MKKLIDSTDNLFWTEKGENFVKLCFCFSPEIEGSLDSDLKFVYEKIAEKIDLDKYNIVSVNEIKHKQKIINIEKGALSEGYLSILIPNKKALSISDLENELKQIRLENSYKVFYYQPFAEIQRQITGSILITQNVFIQSKEFVSCPKNSYYLVIYSVDIYGDAVQNIDWDIKLN